MSRRPNIVWITLDSVRQDRTTMGGHERDTTPRLQALADSTDGTTTEECIAPSIWTLPSSASILTGTYPTHNTVGIDGSRLPDTVRTVAELFGDVGYRTACLSGNSYLSSATGLDRGFDRFQWLSSSTLLRAAGARTLARYLLNIRRHSAGLTLDADKHSTPFLMNAIAKRWVRDFVREDDPFLFYLHYNEPHRPYYPPLPYLDRYTEGRPTSGREAAEVAVDVHENFVELVADGCDLSEGEWASLLAMYDAEVAYTDEMVGRLVEFVRSLDGETVFVITADHGELFGEYGLLAHRFVLHDAVINVPLVIHGGDFGFERNELVQHVDVVQTLLARAGGETEQLQGVDLDEDTREFAVAQRDPAEFDEFLEHNPDFDTSRFHESVLTALRTRRYKYQRSDDGTELFALPDEETDVSDRQPSVREDLAERLEVWLETDGRPVGATDQAEFTEAMRRQLSDLGYLQ